MDNKNVIKCEVLNMSHKDLIKVHTFVDFKKIYNECFEDAFIFKTDDGFYLIGTEVAYLYNGELE